MSAIWQSANWTRQFGIRQTGNRQFGMLPSVYHPQSYGLFKYRPSELEDV
jgi:hypothetical protein